jgi:hypothetical protein
MPSWEFTLHAPGQCDAASWVDCTYISPNPALLKLFTGALWLSNTLQVFSRSSVAYRTCLRPQSLAATRTRTRIRIMYVCSIQSGFPHLQKGRPEDRAFWRMVRDLFDRIIDGPAGPRAVFPRLYEVKGLDKIRQDYTIQSACTPILFIS